MIAMAGLAARVKALIDQITTSVIPAVREVPWAVTALPTAIQTESSDLNTTIIGPMLKAMGCVETTLASNTMLQTIVDVTDGSGWLEFALASGVNASGTLRIVITVDGVDILDTTGPSASTLRTLQGTGGFTYKASPGVLGFVKDRIPFRSSLQVKVQQSTTTLLAKAYTRHVLAAPYTA